MRDFDFLEPSSLNDALAMLAERGGEACVFAGGSALLLAMRQRMLAPDAVVSLGRLEALRQISFDPRTGLRIGAMARHVDIAQSPIVRQHYPMLAGMAAGLANPQIRNQGTIGGNLCYADPSTDPPGCLIALDATVTIAGSGGERRLAMADFVTDFFTTALRDDEILTGIHLPVPTPGSVGFYRRHLRTLAEHRPLANVSLTLDRDDATFRNVRLVIGAAMPVPKRMTAAEEWLNGRSLTPDAAEQAADLVARDLTPLSDGRGDAAFRRQVVRAVTRRLLMEAVGLDWKEAAA